MTKRDDDKPTYLPKKQRCHSKLGADSYNVKTKTKTNVIHLLWMDSDTLVSLKRDSLFRNVAHHRIRGSGLKSTTRKTLNQHSM